MNKLFIFLSAILLFVASPVFAESPPIEVILKLFRAHHSPNLRAFPRMTRQLSSTEEGRNVTQCVLSVMQGRLCEDEEIHSGVFPFFGSEQENRPFFPAL